MSESDDREFEFESRVGEMLERMLAACCQNPEQAVCILMGTVASVVISNFDTSDQQALIDELKQTLQEAFEDVLYALDETEQDPFEDAEPPSPTLN